MSAYALRKTTGPFSGGTRVQILSENKQDKTVTVEVLLPDPARDNYNYTVEEMCFDIPAEDVVKLRVRNESVPAVSRKERQGFLKGLFGDTKEA